MNDQRSKAPETIDELLRWSTSFLNEKGFSSGRLDTEILLCDVLSCRRIDLYLRFDQPLSKNELARFKANLIRRLKHEPVAYIVGFKDFFNLRFSVDRNVLIPRPETELLVERVIDYAKLFESKPIRLLEIGIGSGCIGVSLLHSLKNSTLLAWDISSEALRISRENAKSCGVEETRFHLEQKDGRNEKSWNAIEKFDIIVSNPPYISAKEKESLASSVIDYEPELALIAESDGLAFYQSFAEHARSHLTENGKIFVEIGASQGPKVYEIFKSFGWSDVQIRKDYSRRDRLIEGRYE